MITHRVDHAALYATRLADLHQLIADGADTSEVATRIGINRGTLRDWCRRHGLHNELAGLHANTERRAKLRAEQEEAERIEDITWLAETGESLTGAAARLGVTPDALDKWCERRHLRHVVRTLRARDPFDPTVSPSEAGKVGAAARWRKAS